MRAKISNQKHLAIFFLEGNYYIWSPESYFRFFVTAYWQQECEECATWMAVCTAHWGPHLLWDFGFLVSPKRKTIIGILDYEISTLSQFPNNSNGLCNMSAFAFRPQQSHCVIMCVCDLWSQRVRVKCHLKNLCLSEFYRTRYIKRHKRWQSSDRVMMITMNIKSLGVVSQSSQMDLMVYTAVIGVNDSGLHTVVCNPCDRTQSSFQTRQEQQLPWTGHDKQRGKTDNMSNTFSLIVFQTGSSINQNCFSRLRSSNKLHPVLWTVLSPVRLDYVFFSSGSMHNII